MAQFDVYANPGRNQAAPFLVQIQGSRLDSASGRAVMPLFDRSKGPPDHPLTPHMTVLDRPVFANPFDLATVPAARLGHPLCRLSDTDQDAVLRALDNLVSRA